MKFNYILTIMNFYSFSSYLLLIWYFISFCLVYSLTTYEHIDAFSNFSSKLLTIFISGWPTYLTAFNLYLIFQWDFSVYNFYIINCSFFLNCLAYRSRFNISYKSCFMVLSFLSLSLPVKLLISHSNLNKGLSNSLFWVEGFPLFLFSIISFLYLN